MGGLHAAGSGFVQATTREAVRCGITRNGEPPPMRAGWCGCSQVPRQSTCGELFGLARAAGMGTAFDRCERASPRAEALCAMGPTGFRVAVIPTCLPMCHSSARRRRGGHGLVAYLPGGGAVVPRRGASGGIVAAFGPVAWPPVGSEAKVPILSHMPQRPRGLPGDPPAVGALRGPQGPMFRCPFLSVPDDFGHRNMRTVAVFGRFRSP